MSFKMADEWTCPTCVVGKIDPEELEQVRELLTGGKIQVELRCGDCNEELTADTTQCKDGEVDLNAQWVYE